MDNLYEIYIEQAKFNAPKSKILERAYDKKIYATDKRNNRKI